MTKDTKSKIRDLAEILWQFHNDRLADPSINEMKPYIEPILDLIQEEVRLGRVAENQTHLDRINNYKPKPGQLTTASFGSAGASMEIAGWKRAFEERIAHLNSTALDTKGGTDG